MDNTNTSTIITRWIEVSNAHDVEGYLTFFSPDANIDDPSVGEIFEGTEGIRRYFETYVVGYNTQTRVLEVVPGDTVRVVVEFTGDFPGRRLRGFFDITFDGERFSHIHADLL